MIKYKNDYKYQLAEDYFFNNNFIDQDKIETTFLVLNKVGLTIKKGYAWDGATWYFDKHTIMRGSMAHDALYQLIRFGLIPMSTKKFADKLLEQCCVEDGMSKFEAKLVYLAVRAMGDTYVRPDSRREILIAPKENKND